MKDKEYVSRTQELRRSSATSPVTKPRRLNKMQAIEEQLEDKEESWCGLCDKHHKPGEPCWK